MKRLHPDAIEEVEDLVAAQAARFKHEANVIGNSLNKETLKNPVIS